VRSCVSACLGATILLALAPPRAFGAGGDLLWSDEFHPVDGANGANAIAVNGNRVFVEGRTADVPGGFLVRTYGTATGTLLWSAGFDLAGRFVSAGRVVTHENRVFVAGKSTNASFEEPQFVIVAFDAAAGALLWSRQFPVNGLGLEVSHVALRGRRLFVSGTVHKAWWVDSDIAVLAVDARTGARLWAQQYDLAGGRDSIHGIAVRGNRVFIGGRVEAALDSFHSLVRAYDARTGKLLWEDLDDTVGSSADDIAVWGNRVFVAGSDSNPAGYGTDVLVRAYGPKTGARLWQSRYNREEDIDSNERPEQLALSRGRLFVTAATIPGNSYILIAFEGKTGALLWDAGKVIDEGFFDNMAASRAGVFLAGSTEGFGFSYRVYAHDARTGVPLWGDQIDPPVSGAYAYAHDVAVQGPRVFVCGSADRSGPSEETGTDFVVRAYASR
jgi:outer membrane protein assembly factor BamB